MGLDCAIKIKEKKHMARYALGLDSSTQSLTALMIDVDSRKVSYEKSLNFDEALPQYGTKSGTLPSDDPNLVHSPPLMWVEALDLLMSEAKADGWPLGDVEIIAGSGQQHGTVYLDEKAPTILSSLNSENDLASQLSKCISRETSPIWMDSSTEEDCGALTEAIGGAEALYASTGSSAYERFSGPQIRRFSRLNPADYKKTDHIRLVSSFMASILAGKLVPTDHGDASGMNLLDLPSLKWNQKALEVCGEDLGKKLDEAVPSSTIVGDLSSYFVEKFGFSTTVKVMAWSGDNPNSQVGLGLIEDGDCALSMGTSDVLFATLKNLPSKAGGEGHIFCTPTGDFMSLLCFANGSLAREAMRDAYGLDWKGFDDAIASRPVGNEGAMLLPWFQPEIVPKVLKAGVLRQGMEEADVAANCRAVVEGQLLSRRIHAESLGIRPRVLKVTGGASKNRQIVRIAADVFGCPVQEIEVAASAALGAALRGLHLLVGGDLGEVVAPFVEVTKTTEPIDENVKVYREMTEAYQAFEKAHLN